MKAEGQSEGGAQRAGAPADSASSRDALVLDLEHRIRDLEQQDESAFGSFTRRDWLILLAAALVIPCLLLALFAP